MRLLKIELYNFGSYKELKFDYTNQGLTLIHGDTGSGKSTLQDAAMWVLFGTTAKNGLADDVRPWSSQDITKGILYLPNIRIVRTRGSSNDLYWECDDVIRRGKDLKETQKLINDILGITEDTYINSAYFNEFSLPGQFFLAKAGDRRDLFETLADLFLPILLTFKLADLKNSTRKQLAETQRKLDKVDIEIAQLKTLEKELIEDIEKWDKNHNIEKRREQVNQENKRYLSEELNHAVDSPTTLVTKSGSEFTKCRLCGHYYIPISHTHEQLPFKSQYNANDEKYMPSVYEEQINPHKSHLEKMQTKIKVLQNHSVVVKADNNKILYKSWALDKLQELTSQLRCELLRKVIKQVEYSTNRYLETYFDSELKVIFTLTNTDNIDIEIQKNGNSCNYKQLSKGQRGLLKLCFSVSVMKAAANKSGIHFSSLFFDEALDGLDTNLKLNAFNLFSELEKEHESIFVIEHNTELKTLFSKSFHVSMKEDKSMIEEV